MSHYTGCTIYPVPKALRYIEPGCADIRHLQGVDGQEDACSPVALFIGFLLSFQCFFFSSLKKIHLITTIHNRQTSRNKRNKTQAAVIQAQSFPQKEKIIPVHPLKEVAPLLSPPGSNCLFSSLAGSLFPVLRLFGKKAVFDEATGVAVSLPFRVPIMRSVREKVFPPKFELVLARK